MLNRDNTTNVGDLVEMEFQVHLILKVTGEMETYWRRDIGDVRIHGVGGQHSRKPEFSGWRRDLGDTTQQSNLGGVLTSGI
ncbi:hypothetical protein Acr_10g0004820 [Actinidia rufa]|uniref:Uncharacterized protein n=1 Tax=Actinidia rufa TaxID=165716 RepID=A0A7J0FB20_9ERIC|nr:hypothetical protein Acr_10g0004820 [Actinidia rufa]